MIYFIIGVSLTCNLFLVYEVRRLNKRLDSMYDIVVDKELTEEEEEVWQNMN